MAAASGEAMDEVRYDLVREGVVVLLGMMAGHLQPGDQKVGYCTQATAADPAASYPQLHCD